MKGYGGTITPDSRENEFTAFTVSTPSDMKPVKLLLFFTLLFFTGSGVLLAQTNRADIFQLNKLAGADTLLSGWKIMQGDSLQYARPGYDDSRWPNFDPAVSLDSFKYPGRICWLRLHLKADTALGTADFAFLVYQHIASQLYVDGKLFKTYGTVSPDPVVYNPLKIPEHIVLPPGMHLIAVRFSAPKQSPYFHVDYDNRVLSLHINRYSTAMDDYLQQEQTNDRIAGENLTLLGIFFILTITHLTFYLYNRKQKEHLYYAFVTCMLLIDCWVNIESANTHSLSEVLWLDNLANLTFIGFVFLPLTIYSIFGYSKRWAIKIILIVSAVCMLIQLFNNSYEVILFFYVVPILNAIECVRVAIIARREKQRGAIFIIAGSSLFLILLGLQNSVQDTMGEVLFVLTLLSLPVGMTIFLAIRTALTYRSLEVKLVEVQELSEKNLQHEVEKQQMLASQNETLEQQVTERTAELTSALDNLKSTQTQLIQSEKMASLGELTAGIAHEIQNPLNFVNNFSEVSAELLDELDEELEKGDLEEVKAIAGDVKQNLEKIRHHGKRADGIVRGMLEHSRVSTGKKELIDLNALAEEYLRMAYHGAKAKDNAFNAELITNLEPALPKVSAAPQDIGRVLLNLFNNAFYAVNQKSKTAGPDYKPEVTITTGFSNDNILITVKDNGNGIPDAIKDKIMQPFFTTKPTGEGTGLGLSLTYDMVVKGHDGSINVETKEGHFTQFVIKLPLS